MLSIALIHYPVLNKHGEVVTTSVTNFDLHDLARTSETYGVGTCYIVTPNKAQQEMVKFIQNYWQHGVGADYNTDRKQAFGQLEVSPSLEETCLTIKMRSGKNPRLVATTAKGSKKAISFNKLKEDLRQSDRPHLILFGTGWGLVPQVLEKADEILEPICGPTEYNHLSVRSAVAIVLDRLLGLPNH